MKNIKAFEEYKYFKFMKNKPGTVSTENGNFLKDDIYKNRLYPDVPNEKDPDEPFFNWNKNKYFNKKRNKNIEIENKRLNQKKYDKLKNDLSVVLRILEMFLNEIHLKNVVKIYTNENLFILKNKMQISVDSYKFTSEIIILDKDFNKNTFRYNQAYLNENGRHIYVDLLIDDLHGIIRDDETQSLIEKYKELYGRLVKSIKIINRDYNL